jgi:hypothetical protein
MIYSGRMTTRFFCFFSASPFVCATSGTNVNDIRRIDFKNFRYSWDEPDESDQTIWHWTQLSLDRRFFCQMGGADLLSRGICCFAGVEICVRCLQRLKCGIAEGAITLKYATRGTMNCEYLYLFKIKKGRLRFLGCLRSGSRAYEGFSRTSIENGLLILHLADAEKRRRSLQWNVMEILTNPDLRLCWNILFLAKRAPGVHVLHPTSSALPNDSWKRQ